MLSSLNSSSHCFFGLLSDEVVVAQLVDRALPTPEIQGLNPGISTILSTNGTTEKMTKKKKRRGMANLLKKTPTNDFPVLNKCEDPDA